MSLGQQIFPASGEDIDVLARTVYGEARGEPQLGQIAIAWTVRHRAEIAAAYVTAHGGRWHPHYGGGTLAEACRAARQYSCWNRDDVNRLKLLAVTLDNPVFQQCKMVALGVVHRQMEDRLPGTTHYFNPEGVTHVPAWALPPAINAGRIGHHDFYRGVAA